MYCYWFNTTLMDKQININYDTDLSCIKVRVPLTKSFQSSLKIRLPIRPKMGHAETVISSIYYFQLLRCYFLLRQKFLKDFLGGIILWHNPIFCAYEFYPNAQWIHRCTCIRDTHKQGFCYWYQSDIQIILTEIKRLLWAFDLLRCYILIYFRFILKFLLFSS